MKSDPKDCLYCQNNETLHNLMIEIAQLSVSRVFLFKEQTYRGRCLVGLNRQATRWPRRVAGRGLGGWR